MSQTAALTPGQSTRRAAVEALARVFEQGRTIEQALAETQSFSGLSARDRGFAYAMVLAAARGHGPIEARLARHISRPLPAHAGAARAILRTGAAQILDLGTPPHAAVFEAVALARSLKEAAPYANLINAVLRKIAQEPADALAREPERAFAPAWLWTRWRAAYGEARADAIAGAARVAAPLDLTVKADAAGWAERLGGMALGPSTVRLASGAGVETLAGFETGDWWVQDLAATLPVHLLAPQPGEAVADLCAAPGGKTMQLCASGAAVTAVDRSAGRVALVAENLARTGFSATLVTEDVERWNPAERFDAVLLDAPCTATGTFRRHPEGAWIKQPGDIPALAALQRRLAAAAARALKPGGRMVYAVCSLEPEEGPAQAAWIAQELGLARAPFDPAALPGLAETINVRGELRTLPSMKAEVGGMDGFFAAAFVKPS